MTMHGGMVHRGAVRRIGQPAQDRPADRERASPVRYFGAAGG